MKIEIALPQRFSQSGKSLLRLIQNNDMPILDLLVRESIQNSLDAWDGESENVLVEFFDGKFESQLLASELEGITSSLNKKYGAQKCSYIAVSDSNTSGLTGDINNPNGEDGNLQKLIYQICHAQEGEGAGGSWGIGKTVYFRVGIGLVIYYSRIRLENGKYQSRMAASLVEDESKSDSMIPCFKNEKGRGVAWWGTLVRENLTIATTDDKEINKMLSIFGLSPYSNNKVGTTIIIPYTDNQMLLSHNIMEYEDSLNCPISLPWTNDVKRYLSLAVQKWYAPRLNNRYYFKNSNSAYLSVKINGKDVGNIMPDDDDTEPFFKLIKALYNRAAYGNAEYGDIISKTDYNSVSIDIKNTLVSQSAGNVASIMADKTMLKMIPPYNKFEPFFYINKEASIKGKNRPIICYVRKPGMVVSYETVSEWTEGISPPEENYIIGIFVLNSDNRLREEIGNITLEEYVRQSELADHTSWSDITVNKKNPRIVAKIKKHVSGKVGNAYNETVAEEGAGVNSSYSKLFGDILLPPDNFGKRPNNKRMKTEDDNTTVLQHKDVTLSIKQKDIKYKYGELYLKFKIKTKKPIDYLEIDTLMAKSDSGGSFSLNDWIEQVGNYNGSDIVWPFDLVGADFSMSKWEDDKTISLFAHLNEQVSETVFKKFTCTYKHALNGEICGIKMESEKKHSFEFTGTFILRVNRMEFNVMLGLTTKRGES